MNPYTKPNATPFATLPDGAQLYPAFHPLRPGERFRRSMRSWNGAVGEHVGVTKDGKLYRQAQMWGGEGWQPERWERFTVR